MDDLESNPLYKAFLTKFRREFDIACKMSYLIAIPHSDSLDDIDVDNFLVNSHILMPSKLLKSHYTPLQIGNLRDIEIDGNKLIVQVDKRRPKDKFVVTILAEEMGYNAKNREYRVLLIDRPLLILNENHSMGGFLSTRRSIRRKRKTRPLKPLADHDDCSKYLEFISQELTIDLEVDVKLLQSNYMILSQYMDDAAERIKDLAEAHVPKFEFAVERRDGIICDSIRRAIRISVETHVLHLLHGKLMTSIHSSHERDDQKLLNKFIQIKESELSVGQLGAQTAFADFSPSEELLHEIQRLPTLQSPLALVSSITRIIEFVNEGLNQSVKFRNLMADGSCKDQVSICSDDLIASLVFSLAQAKPAHLFSVARYLDTFGWNSCAKDRAAYYTATFQIVIQYVFGYTNEESTKRADDKIAIYKLASKQFADSMESASSSTIVGLDQASSLITDEASKGNWDLV